MSSTPHSGPDEPEDTAGAQDPSAHDPSAQEPPPPPPPPGGHEPPPPPGAAATPNVPAQPPGAGGFAPAAPSQEARNWALAAHLSSFITFVGIPWFIGPLVVWAIKRGDDPFIEAHTKEAVNFNLSMLIYGAVLVVGGGLFSVVTFGLGLIPVVLLVLALVVLWFVLTIIAAVKASNGELYEYALTIRLIQ